MINIESTFEKYESEYRKFDRVENKLNAKPDLCAFLLLDRLVPDDPDDDEYYMVCSVVDGTIYLDTDCQRLAEVAMDTDIRTLIRCGVLYDSDTDSLKMFV